jgi:phosphoribosylamine--glycine ligase
LKVLVVGGGAREHALCDAVVRSKDSKLYSLMSNQNPGIVYLAEEYLIEKETNVDAVVTYAQKHQIDLVLIGPEAPLEKGLVDALQTANITTCAPTKEAARIETDKQWMRNLLQQYAIPGQLRFECFSDVKKARRFIEEFDGNVALKPIGLTGGKGVQVAGDHFQGIDGALTYIKEVIQNKIGGQAKILIEEKAIGEEFTLQAFSDGSMIIPLPAVQDHKRLLPDDQGPNTGGMGSYSSANGLLPFLSRSEYEEGATILQKIIEALALEGCPYIGPIYGQFMLTAAGPKIIEINARFGDPEAMNVLPLLQTDFLNICNAMITHSLSSMKIKMREKATVCKYVVPEGYGIKSQVNEVITVDETAIQQTGAKLFYASVNKQNSSILTTSSRSLAIVGIADTLTKSEAICEKGLSYITSDHIFIRHDIGTPALIENRMHHINMLRGTQ